MSAPTETIKEWARNFGCKVTVKIEDLYEEFRKTLNEVPVDKKDPRTTAADYDRCKALAKEEARIMSAFQYDIDAPVRLL